MSESRIKYLLGIDGGGTKTEFLLTDIDEKEIKRVVLATSNPVNVGIEKAEEVLRQGIMQLCEGLDFAEISVFAGLAGGVSQEINSEIRRFLGSFGFGAYSNATDADSALAVALRGGEGTAVIMGTGVIAFTRSEGEIYRTGGRGYMIDKGGSGFCFGSDALNSAIEYLDGRGGSKLIFDLVTEKLGKDIDEAIPEIYAGGTTRVASFAPVVFDAYLQGDADAKRIIDRNAYEVAKIIKAARRHLKKTEKTVICGGLCKQSDILRPFLLSYLEEDAPVIFSTEPIINGAVLLAKDGIYD